MQFSTSTVFSSPTKAKWPQVDSRWPPRIQRDNDQRKLDRWAEDAPCRAFPQCLAQVNSTCGRSKRGRGTLYRDIGCHITYALPPTEWSQNKQPSQALLLQTEYTLNKDCFIALLYSTHVMSKGLFAWLGFCLGGGFDGVTLFWNLLAKQD